MGISLTQRNDLMNLVVGMFDAAPSEEIVEAFIASLEAGQSLQSLANDLAATDEFKSLYSPLLTDEEFATSFATNILDGNTDAAGLALAISEVELMLANGLSRGDVAYEAAKFLASTDVTDPTFGDAAQALLNKSTVATEFALNQSEYGASYTLADLQAKVAGVDATAASVTAQMQLNEAGVSSLNQYLTVGQDVLVGTSGNDAFKAWIFNNSNSAQSGDMIDGGAGTDSLYADVGDSQSFAITLHTESVEVAKFRAQDTYGADNKSNDITPSTAGNIHIDAERMNGTVEFWSVDSRADLVIEDIQNGSASTTIGWQDSDSGDVDYEVYFDNITDPGTVIGASQLTLELLDLEGQEKQGDPLLNNPYVGFTFTRDGELIEIAADEPVAGEDATYQQLVDGINALLVEQGLGSEIVASLGGDFSRFNSESGNSQTGTQIILTDSTGAELVPGEWTLDGGAPATSNVYASIVETEAVVSSQMTKVNIVFDYVGSGSKSGDFIAGEISQTLQNAGFPVVSNENAGSSTPGIEHFDIEVRNSSWMDSIASTNNTLEYVEVVNGARDATDLGYLRIDDLDDVRLWDSSAMNSFAVLNADITDAVVAKYFDLDDTANDDGADNTNGIDGSEFIYEFGGSNDVLHLDIQERPASHEDFTLLIDTGSGNDTVFTNLVDTGATGNINWLANQQTLNNLTIDSGDGNDYIWTIGEGNFTIEAGSGDDVVYTNNDALNSAGVSEQQTISFSGVDLFGKAGTEIEIGNVTVNLTATADSASELAARVIAGAVLNLNGGTQYDFNGDGVADTIALGTATAAVKEVQTITINEGITAAAGTIILTASDGDGTTTAVSANLAASDSAANIALKLANAINTDGTNSATVSGSTITITSGAAGSLEAVTEAYISGGTATFATGAVAGNIAALAGGALNAREQLATKFSSAVTTQGNPTLAAESVVITFGGTENVAEVAVGDKDGDVLSIDSDVSDLVVVASQGTTTGVFGGTFALASANGVPGAPGSAEVQNIDFGAIADADGTLVAGQYITVGGHKVSLTTGTGTAANIATDVVGALNGQDIDGDGILDAAAIDGVINTVVAITYGGNADKAAIAVTDGNAPLGRTTPVTTSATVDGSATTAETTTLTVDSSLVVTVAGNLTITDGAGAGADLAVAVSVGDTASTIALKIASAINGAVSVDSDAALEFATATGNVVTIVGGANVNATHNLSLVSTAASTAVLATTQAITAAVTETREAEAASSTEGAEWSVNAAVASNDNDLLTNGVAGTSALLYKSTLTVTYSGAGAAGSSGVISGNADSFTNGFESTVTVGTTNYFGDRTHINQAIKDAIENSATLSDLLQVEDGPGNTLVIRSLVDGRFVDNDLQIEINAADYSKLTTTEQNSLVTAWETAVHNSALNPNSADMQTILTAAATTATTAVDPDVLTVGSASTTDSDNKVDLGNGNDVLVLGTSGSSTDTIVFEGSSIGSNVIFNFDANGGTDADILDFTSYLNGKTSASKSTESATVIVDTAEVVSAAGGGSADADEVIIINDFTGTTSQTWSAMTGANLLSAIVNTSTVAYGNLGSTTLNVTEKADLVGTTQKNIVLVENDANQGEYKVFDVTSTVGATDEFTSATLLGTVDFGNSITATVDLA